VSTFDESCQQFVGPILFTVPPTGISMEVNCEGCAGCCVDWRPLAPNPDQRTEPGDREFLDDAYNPVPLEVDEVRAFVDAGLGDALTPRLWRITDPAVEGIVEIDGEPLAAIDGRPAFYVGLRTSAKPVAPVGHEVPTWLPTCPFLDPATLQCRIHEDELYPTACRTYPGANLAMEQETECERVERATGDERLLDATPPETPSGLRLGPQAIGAKLYGYPDPDRLEGRIDRIAAGTPSAEDRATFVATAAASSPGSLSVDRDRYETAYERVLDADSWVQRAIDDWEARAGEIGTNGGEPGSARIVEEERGAPGTPGWDRGDGPR
jgi:Fe-S-cluster containining protein